MKKRCLIGLCLVVLILLTGCGQKNKDTNVNTEISSASKENIQDSPAAGGEVSVASKQEKVRPVYDYVFNLKDKKAVSESSGTGGTEWRGNVAEDYSKYIKEIYNNWDNKKGAKPPFEAQGVEFGDAMRVVGLENKTLMDEMNAFLADAEERLAYDDEYCAGGSAANSIMIREEYGVSGDCISLIVNSFGADDKTISATFNMRTGKRLALSDLFFDGFNYIDFINCQIADQLPNSRVDMFGENYANDELLQKRAFTGIAEDYPYFTIFCGVITIYFPNENPFFCGMYDDIAKFDFSLGKDISPYGDENFTKQNIRYEKVKLNGNLFVLRSFISGFNDIEIENKVNQAVWQLITKIQSDMKDASTLNKLKGYMYFGFLEPAISNWRNIVCITFTTGLSDGGPIQNPLMIDTISVDINTGEIVDLTKQIPSSIDWSKATYYSKAVPGVDSYEALDSFDVSNFENAKITAAWIRDDYSFVIDFELGDGTKLTAYVPIEELEKAIGEEGN